MLKAIDTSIVTEHCSFSRIISYICTLGSCYRCENTSANIAFTSSVLWKGYPPLLEGDRDTFMKISRPLEIQFLRSWAYFKAGKLLYRTRESTGTRESKEGESTSPKSWTPSSSTEHHSFCVMQVARTSPSMGAHKLQ